MSETPPAATSKGTNWRSIALRVGVASGALLWTFSKLDPGQLLDATLRIDPRAVGAAVAFGFLGLVVGALRWSVLLRAYGATSVPSVWFLTRVYFVGIFYNTFLPANVGGDILRGYVTRRSFDGAAGAYLIVLVERVFGLAGLFLLGATAVLLRPLELAVDSRLIGLAGLVLSFGAFLGPTLGRRLGPWVPGPPGRLLTSLPMVQRPTLLVPVLLLSMTTQLMVAVSGHVLLRSLSADVELLESLVLVPLAMISLYLPTIAGLGVREAAFVVLFGEVGVSAADATVASLGLFTSQLVVALVGGAWHLAAPLRVEGGVRRTAGKPP